VEARFSALVQNSPGAHAASYTTGTGSLSRVKAAGHGIDHPPSSRVEVKKRVELHLHYPYGPL